MNSLFTLPQPPPEVVKDIIVSSAYDSALEKMSGYRIYEQTDSQVKFGVGLYSTLTVQRADDGTLSCQSKPNLPLRNPGHDDDHISSVWSSMKSTASTFVGSAVRNEVRVDGFSTEAYGDDSLIKEEIERTASGIRATLGLGYAEKPGHLLRHILNRLLDPRVLRDAIRYGGNVATIMTYNDVIAHRDTLERAYRISPNLLITWMSDHERASRKLEKGITPEEIVEDVCERYSQWAHVIPDLSIKLVRETHPETKKYRHMMSAIQDAGIPSYTICRVMLTHGRNMVLPRSISATRELRRLSLLSARRRGSTQKRLASQARTVMREISGIDAGELEKIGFCEEPATDPDWDALVKLARERKKRRIADNRRYAMPMKKAAKRRRKKTHRDPTFEDMLARLDKQAIARIDAIIASDVPIAVERGQSLVIRAHGDQDNFLSLQKTECGVIKSNQPYLDLKSIHTDLDTGHIWTSMGFGKIALASVISAVVSDGWDIMGDDGLAVLAPIPRRIVPWLPKIAPILDDTSRYDDEAMSRQMTDALISLMDPFVLSETIMRHGTQANIWHYNQAVMRREFTSKLSGSNNAIDVWMQHDHRVMRSIEDFNHVGELVSAVRERMSALGFNMRMWKALNRLPMPEVNKVLMIESDSPTLTLVALEVSAQTERAPDSKVLSTALRSRNWRKPCGSNHVTAIRLLLKASSELSKADPSADHKPVADQLYDVCDYVNGLDRENMKLRSTTWSGLVKKSDRWHRENFLRQYSYMFDDVLAAYQGHYRRWHSLVGRYTYEERNITLSAIDSDLGLFHETADMRHCVVGYGDQCERGSTRIFQIHKDEKHIGTAEIVLDEKTWKVGQVRGELNRPLGADVALATKKLVGAYQRRWMKEGSEHKPYHVVPFTTDPVYERTRPS